MKYDKANWTKASKWSYEHISGQISIEPAFDKITQKVSYWVIFYFKGGGFIREVDRVVNGSSDLLETMQKAVEDL